MSWLSGWRYRRPVTISRASGAVVDYQLKLLVGESSTSATSDVRCAGHALSNMNDLRFTSADGTTLLPYWIESITGTTPNQVFTVWINFDSIGTSATTFYMYYGNAVAAAASSGADTFIAFDNFERGADGDTVGGIWTEGSAHAHISTDHAFSGTRCVKFVGVAAASYVGMYTSITHSNMAYKFRAWHENATNGPDFWWGDASRYQYTYVYTDEKVRYNDGSDKDTGLVSTKDTWAEIEVYNINFTAHTYSLRVNTSTATGLGMLGSAGAVNKLGFRIYTNGVGNDAYLDDIIVRQYLSTEPAWGTWGNEETSNWLGGWSYRKSISVSRPSGAVTNYQMKIVIGETTGSDVALGGHARSNLNDLRFTNSSGITLLDYWIESISGVSPNQIFTVWVEFDTIEVDNKIFYMYYGKGDAPSYSNGANTFVAFDDFERGSNNDPVGGSWTVLAGSVVISNEQSYSPTRSMKLVATATQPQLHCNHTHGDGTYAIYVRCYQKDTCQSNFIYHGDGIKSLQMQLGLGYILYRDTGWHSTGYVYTENEWFNMELKNINFTTGTYDIYYNNELVNAGTSMATSATYSDKIYIAGDNSLDGDVYYDNFIVRNWRSTEPTLGTWGSETNAPARIPIITIG